MPDDHIHFNDHTLPCPAGLTLAIVLSLLSAVLFMRPLQRVVATTPRLADGDLTGVHLVYLDIWEREVDALNEPDLVDSALGVDTTTRVQTVSEECPSVKRIPCSASRSKFGAGIFDCGL